MNANELADKIEDARNETDFQKWAGQAPDMLRQQQAEIANLKAGLLSHHDIYPVKELTDEEIYEVWSTLPYDDQCPFDGRATYRFARAILKKASEK